MFGIGLPELIIILVILLLVFGGKKLPELSKSIAEALSIIRKGVKDDEDSSEKQKISKKKSSK